MNDNRLHFLLLNIGHALNHYMMLIFPTALLGMTLHWEGGYSTLLNLGVWGVIAYGVGSLPAGWLGDKWGMANMMNVFFFGIGAASIFIAFAYTPFQLTIGIVAIGLFASIYHPVGIALIFSTSGSKVGRAIAINGVSGNIGVALATLTTAFLTSTFGWEISFIIPGILCLIMGCIYYVVTKEVVQIAPIGNTLKKEKKGFNVLFSMVFFLIIIVAFGGIVFQSITTALPKIIEMDLHVELSTVGLFATIILAIASLSQLLVGECIGKVTAKWLLAILTFCQAGCLYLASLTTGTALMAALTGLLFSTFGQIPVNDWLIGQYASTQWRARIYAIKYALSASTGPVAYFLISRSLDKNNNFEGMYFVLTVAMIIACGSALLMAKSTRKGT